MRIPSAIKNGSTIWPSLLREAAFTRTDLVAVIVLVALVGSFLAYKFTGERARIHRCANNLKKLGTAMHEFANEHNGGLPPAAIVPGLSWDVQLKSYLLPGKEDSDSGYERKEFSPAITPFFLCPSFHESREISNDNAKTAKNPNQNNEGPIHASRPQIHRSYAMSKCDLVTVGWPLSADSPTGVGVVWDLGAIEDILGKDFLDKARNNPDSLPMVKLSIITDPANTLLLTEFPKPRSVLGNVGFTAVESVKEQYSGKDNPKQLHGEGRNYLMVDGHVEFLTREQAGFKNNQPAGIWTIKKVD